MIWGAMTYRGTDILTRVDGRLNGNGYVNILEKFAVPSAHLLGYGDNYWLQHDNAPCHGLRLVQEWKVNNGITYLECPPLNHQTSIPSNICGGMSSVDLESLKPQYA